MKQLDLSFFIVPNSIESVGWVTTSDVGGTHLWDRDLSELIRQDKFIGNVHSVQRGEPCVQVWIHCPAEGTKSNWTDHGIPEEYQDVFGWSEKDADEDWKVRAYAPRSLPMSFLKNFKEGTTIDLKISDDLVVTLTAEQLPYRYGRFGRFEEVLERLKLKYNHDDDMQWHHQHGDVLPKTGKTNQWPYAMEYKD